MLVNGDIAMGTFLVNWGVFGQVGDLWADIYRRVLDIDECCTNLSILVRLMNLPTSDESEKSFRTACDSKGRELATSFILAPEDIAADNIPICVDNLSHSFAGSTTFRDVSVTLDQGSLHVIAGRRGSGKSTLLRLIGCRIMKLQDSEGSLLVPAHLRTLHISKEPLFFCGSLYDNLTYGVQKEDRDGNIARVLEICRLLEIREKTLALITEANDAEVDRWNEHLSRSDCQLLNIARGLVANPELLCVHKPSMGLGPHTVPCVFTMLQKFVNERGVLQNMERYFFRRPRTCVYTFNMKGDEAYADVIHEPFSAAAEPFSPYGSEAAFGSEEQRLG